MSEQSERKQIKMKNKRIVSFQSRAKVCHKPGCKYTKRIKASNYLVMTKQEADVLGYRICQCCNSMNHLIQTENNTLNYYKKQYNMAFKYINGILYVKTELNCWKLIYSRSAEKIVIYHRNASEREIDFERPDQENYHLQIDIKYVKNIQNALKYIYEHDKYWMSEQRGSTISHFSSKKYEKQAKKRQRKHSIEKVDKLFRLLETQNPEYCQISCN